MTVKDIRRRNLMALVKQEADGNIAEFARRFTLNDKYIRLIKGKHSECGHQFARDIEAALARVKGGEWDGWMDRDHGTDLDSDALLVARRWKALSVERREFLLSQFMLAEKLNFGRNPQTNEHAGNYAQMIEEFRKAPQLIYETPKPEGELKRNPGVVKLPTRARENSKKQK
jgi:hypothetical protein